MIRKLRFWLTSAAVAAMVVSCGGTATDTSSSTTVDDGNVATMTGTVHAYENGYQDRVRMATDAHVTVSNYPDIVGSWDSGKWVLTEVPTDAIEICAHLDDVSNCSAVTVTPDSTVEVTLNLGSESPATSEPTTEYTIVMEKATVTKESPTTGKKEYLNVQVRMWPDGKYTFYDKSGSFNTLENGCTPGQNEIIGDGDFDCQIDAGTPAAAWYVDDEIVVEVHNYDFLNEELADEPLFTLTVTEQPLAE